MNARSAPTDPSHLNSYPAIRVDDAIEIASGVTVVPDPRVNFVPNIGIISGDESVLVVDTGIGIENGRRVLELARSIAGQRALLLTITHFHPEHGYGAQVFKGAATILYNKAQRDELDEKGSEYLSMFRGYGANLVDALAGVDIVGPDQTYSGATTLDLGNRRVVLRESPAHTRGDQIVHLPDDGIVFTGDLVENAFFPIFADADSKAGLWMDVLKTIESLRPAIVVPGHGAVGGTGIVRSVSGYMEFVRGQVAGLSPESDEDEVDRLVAVVKAHFPTWDNDKWIVFAVRTFFAEATGRPLRLPPQ
jgi:glyoxylase-like metal-dependent hydrolase (beta-lactamase superfamily II)